MGHTVTDTQDGLNVAVFFFVKILLFFYWSIIALQYCVSFCCTVKWISCVCVTVCSYWVAQSCLTVCNPMDCSPLASSGGSCHFLFQGIFLIQGLNPCLQWWRISYMYSCIPALLSLPPSHLSRSSQSTKLSFRVYSSFPLAVGFTHGGIYICQPYYPDSSPHPPHVAASPFSMSASLFLLCLFGSSTPLF